MTDKIHGQFSSLEPTVTKDVIKDCLDRCVQSRKAGSIFDFYDEKVMDSLRESTKCFVDQLADRTRSRGKLASYVNRAVNDVIEQHTEEQRLLAEPDDNCCYCNKVSTFTVNEIFI
jgi:hypothetical protein